MTNERLVEVGDIIQSKKFTYGDSETKRDQKISSNQTALWHNGIVTIYGESEAYRTNINAYDKDRAKAHFVVEEAKYDGGSTGRDPYPDGWHVLARKLNKDDQYNPNGELIEFYQTGCFNCMVKNPKIIGKMKKTVNFQK